MELDFDRLEPGGGGRRRPVEPVALAEQHRDIGGEARHAAETLPQKRFRLCAVARYQSAQRKLSGAWPMDRATEIELLEELVGLRRARAFFVDDEIATSPVARYTSPERFSREREALFRVLPAVVAHSSELSVPDSFLTRDFAGLPLLLTRDGGGALHAFLKSAAIAAPGWSVRRAAAGAVSSAPITAGPGTTGARSTPSPMATPVFPASTGGASG